MYFSKVGRSDDKMALKINGWDLLSLSVYTHFLSTDVFLFLPFSNPFLPHHPYRISISLSVPVFLPLVPLLFNPPRPAPSASTLFRFVFVFLSLSKFLSSSHLSLSHCYGYVPLPKQPYPRNHRISSSEQLSRCEFYFLNSNFAIV